ncbi:MAG: SRPBCC family protein [Halioglobus sp.]|nr:SRPBCC family protein [Halioglobus sp.]
MPQQATADIIIDLPRAEAWAKLRDISLAHNYVPGIIKTEVVTAEREGVGASRYVYRSAKSYLQETVTEWREGEGFRIKLHKGDKPAPPFREAFFNYQLDEAGPGQTRFTATLGYQMPWGVFGEWLGRRMQGFVQSTVADVTAAMKLYYETGQPTTPAALKAYKDAVA